jgi:penicillin amidase
VGKRYRWWWPGLLLVVTMGCGTLNAIQRTGELRLPGLAAPVSVSRDEKGMAMIHASNQADALRALGFVSAQDRLFQMELSRRVAAGRVSELVGEQALALDVRMRTIGFARQARRHADLLDAGTRAFIQAYLDGVNAYIEGCRNEHPLEFRLADLQPAPWQIEDTLALLYYMSWNSSANLQAEILMHMLVEKLGWQRAQELRPLNVNPDAPAPEDPPPPLAEGSALAAPSTHLAAFLHEGSLRLGSNNWAVAPTRSGGGGAAVASDPHLDVRLMPGPWYPAGLVCPGYRIVGASIPGLPGMVVFRTNHVAAGITNSYADTQDLYAETPDPAREGHYLEGRRSLPFEVRQEAVRVRDPKAPGGFRDHAFEVRATRRGPVISGVVPPLASEQIMTLRWAPFETMGPRLGLQRAMFARSAAELREILAEVNLLVLNFVFADREGHIGWFTSGKIPIRANGDGTLPRAVGGDDDWSGWIPPERMPQAMDPDKGWLGTCNHKTVTAGYPYYLSSYFAPSFRYQRLTQLLETPMPLAAEDHWRFQRDTRNLLAERLAPLLAAHLLQDPETRDLGAALNAWDHCDRPESTAPAIFQEIYGELARQTFADELGAELTEAMLGVWYFWQERFARMLQDGRSAWFDDLGTADRREGLAELVSRAGHAARANLTRRLGSDPDRWQWGRLHQLELVSPVRRKGFGKGLLGGGRHPMAGSGETLLRGSYAFNVPYDVVYGASLRMVADFSDPDKVLAVLPGGVSGRVFDPHYKDQIGAYLSGAPVYWWFSPEAVAAHTRSTLLLAP